ncbi:lipoyl protein ligase domain-containing protein [Prochlorococcus marinus]|uniref:lipoyl protein ligase domain-containing protein n=1 Tax=Prochlorococcus marinus TaxID=1219 RepID=UPI0022B5B4C0|nr:lipoate--protein ligase family protein [Prochlorococcus marinus]
MFIGPKINGEIINSVALSGPEQMAADVMMLEKLIHRNDEMQMTVRFYTWQGIWLSIGHNQNKIPKEWIDLNNEKKLKIVRRPTGGTGVLHGGGLTYSLAWKSPPRKRHKSYIEASQWLINCFTNLGFPLKFGNQNLLNSSKNCFSTSSAADLIDEKGIKRIGSAQLWKQGHVLQHGEILLDPPKQLWKEIFLTDPPTAAPNKIPRVGLEKLLINALVLNWPNVKWTKNSFTAEELTKITASSKSYLKK